MSVTIRVIWACKWERRLTGDTHTHTKSCYFSKCTQILWFGVFVLLSWVGFGIIRHCRPKKISSVTFTSFTWHKLCLACAVCGKGLNQIFTLLWAIVEQKTNISRVVVCACPQRRGLALQLCDWRHFLFALRIMMLPWACKKNPKHSNRYFSVFI